MDALAMGAKQTGGVRGETPSREMLQCQGAMDLLAFSHLQEKTLHAQFSPQVGAMLSRPPRISEEAGITSPCTFTLPFTKPDA